ncbi:MAG: hypothetical protein ACR2I2_06785, partial [Bryobacteraceae bacterium]
MLPVSVISIKKLINLKHDDLAPSLLRAMLLLLECQGQVEMSYSRPSRNVLFGSRLPGVHVSLVVPVKRRRALVAT